MSVTLEVRSSFTNACKFTDFEKFRRAIKDNPDGVRLDDNTVLCWIE